MTIVSGHSAVAGELDYESLARTPGTLVVFMGLRRLGQIAAGLIACGRDPETPAAVIAAATTSDRAGRDGTAGESRGRGRGFPSPSLVVVGDVVRLRTAFGMETRLVEAHA